MAGPAYHGRTHAPGGTDPIPNLAAGTSLPVAFAQDGLRSQTDSGFLNIDFKFISWNDDTVFDYAVTDGGTPLRARYITVTPGTYIVKGMMSWNSAITANDSIQLTVYFPSTASSDLLINSVGVDSFNIEASGIWNEQKTTDEKAHLSLHDEIGFSWTTADWGETTLGLGIGLTVASSTTKNFAGQLMVVRLGDATTEQTIT